jgi:hypothetical protein
MDSEVRFAQQERLAKRSSETAGGEGTEENRCKDQRLLSETKNKDIV